MRKVVYFFLMPILFLSLILSLAGIKYISFGSQYYDFMRYVVIRAGGMSFNIPQVPKVPKVTQAESGIAEVYNAVLVVINGIVALVNFIITIINLLIDLITFIFSIMSSLFTYKWSGSSRPELMRVLAYA